MTATYTYSVTNDFANGVAVDRLSDEITGSPITVALRYIDASTDDCAVTFSADLNTEETTTLDNIVAQHSGEPYPEEIDPKNPSGIPIFQPTPREGSSRVMVSYNWCDRCTWYGDSVLVTDEVLTDSGDGVKFTATHAYWIDLTHGRYYGEDRISSLYRPSITVDGTAVTERAAYANEGGDYVINYEDGTVTFFTPPTGVVRANYSYENGSTFYIRPSSGKILVVEDSEVQFSLDVVMRDSIFFQAWAYNPYDLPNKVPVSQTTTYKTIRDFIDESRGVYPVIPAIGGSVRGTTHDCLNFPFLYKTVKELQSSMGLEIRVWLGNDSPMQGEFATASFYCTSKEEV